MTAKQLVKNKSNLKQEAQGACGAHLVLTNPLGFVQGLFQYKILKIFGVGNYGTIQNTLFMQT